MVDFGINKTQESVPNLPNTMGMPNQGRMVEDTNSQTGSKTVTDTAKPETAAPKGMKEVIDQLVMEIGSKEGKVETEAPEESFKDSREELNKAVGDLNSMAKSMRNEVRFQISEELGELIVQVIDRETHEVIRTIPPEYLVDLKVKLRHQVGLVLDREL